MDKKSKSLLAAVGVLSAVTAGTLVGMSRFMSYIAVNRKIKEFPESMQNIVSGGTKSDPRLYDMKKAEEDAAKIEMESVSIESHDGLTLNGHFYPAENQKRIVIAMHGWRSSFKMDFGAVTGFYHDAGCSLLFPDERGTGESDGDYIGFGVLERFDCLEWIKYIVSRFGTTTPVYLLGVSMGATTVLMTAGFELPSCVCGIISDCGFTSPHAIWAHILENNLHITEKIAYPILNRMCQKKAQFDGDEYSTLEALENNTIPVLFIHGGADGFVPLGMTFENYEKCTAPKELLVIPGAGHGMSCITDPRAYQKAVTQFFGKYDGGNENAGD